MNKIISIFLLSIVIQGYNNECIKNWDNTCSGGEEHVTTCILKDGTCVEEKFCEKIEDGNKPGDYACVKAMEINQGLDCIYDLNSKICQTTEICEITNADENVCKNILTSSPLAIKCYYLESFPFCMIKKLCEEEENPSEEKCNQIPTPDPLKTKCVYDQDSLQCVIKNLCNSSLNSDQCSVAEVENPESTRCIYDNGCKLKELCEIEEEPSEEKCQSIRTSKDSTQCVFEINKCIVEEINKEISTLNPEITESTEIPDESKKKSNNQSSKIALSLNFMIFLFSFLIKSFSN